ncbi:MAG: glycosyltransferase, partial [Pseudomonadota bacterium]
GMRKLVDIGDAATELGLDPETPLLGYVVKGELLRDNPKLVEGMAQGKAMVVSSVTLQGVEDVCGPGIACADTGEEVSGHIIRLLRDEAARTDLGEKALAIAREQFSAKSVHADLRDWAEGVR